uniref:Transposase n=1 Tax=Heterorhabditis bacteriophora TaxID=37862 RepID=A0A1I7X1J4_HETBA
MRGNRYDSKKNITAVNEQLVITILLKDFLWIWTEVAVRYSESIDSVSAALITQNREKWRQIFESIGLTTILIYL